MNEYLGLLIGILIVIVVILVVSFLSFKHFKTNKTILNDSKNVLNRYGQLIYKKPYYEYELNGEKYLLTFFYAPTKAKVKFNSMLIWEKRTSYQTDLENMMSFSTQKGKKIVIIYPNEGPYMYHYDEREILFTKPYQPIWEMHVVGYHELEEALEKGFKK